MTAAKSTRSKRNTIAEEVDELRETIGELVNHVACLTLAVDELADQVQGQSKLLRDGRYPPTPKLASMPLDPTTADWQINRASAANLPENQPAPAAAMSQQNLFDETEADSSIP